MQAAQINNSSTKAMHVLQKKVPTSILGQGVRDHQELAKLKQQWQQQSKKLAQTSKQLDVLQDKSQTLLELNKSLKQSNQHYAKQVKALRQEQQHAQIENQQLKSELQNQQHRNAELEKKCKSYIEQLQMRTEDMESTANKLCSTSAELNQNSEQQAAAKQQYEQLLEAYEKLQEKHEALLHSGRFANTMDQYIDKALTFKESAQQQLAKLTAKKPQETVVVVEEVAEVLEEKPVWISLNKQLPDSTGMYKVSNGNQSALAYFNAETQAFKQPNFDIKFWLQRPESAGHNANNNGF